MEMGNYVSQQLLVFLRSIALGACLGLAYDLLGALRRLGGRLWGGLLDAAFCLSGMAAVGLFVLAGDGELRIFIALGILGGAVLFWCLPGPVLRPVWAFWVELALLPARLAGNILKKGCRGAKKVFSFCGKRCIIKFTLLKTRPRRQEGEEAMGRPADNRKAPAPRKKRGKGAPRSGGRLTVLLLAALLVAIGLQVYRMTGQLREARAEEAIYARQLEELRETNGQLQADLDNKGDQALIEDFARDQLGMVLPGEKVFHISK